MIELDAYQQAALGQFNGGEESVAIQAAPGSGKSEILSMGIQAIPDSLIAFTILTAFNNHSIDALGNKCKGRVQRNKGLYTTYALGSRAVRSRFRPWVQEWVDPYKYNIILKEILKGEGLQEKDRYIWEDCLSELWNMARLTLTNLTDIKAIEKLVLKYVPDNPASTEKTIEIMLRLKGKGIERARNKIDFTDMVWMPHALDLPCETMRCILVDEAQDLNAAQHDVLIRHASDETKWMIVGDRNQAVYGWAGAMPGGMTCLAKRIGVTKGHKMPITYRCPASHIKKAQEYFSDIKAAPNAIEGVIEDINFSKLLDLCRADGTKPMIASRTTAPLILACYELIEAGVPAYVKGKSIGKGLNRLIDTIAAIPGGTFDTFINAIRDYRWQMETVLPTEQSVSDMYDRCDTLEVIYKRVRARNVSTISGFKLECERIFSEGEKEGKQSGVRLATWHSQKGEENKVVIHLRPEDMPHAKAITGEQKAEEKCLQYIAATRSKEFLYNLSGVGMSN